SDTGTGSAAGTASFDATTGEMTYTPAASETGEVTLVYEVCNTTVTPNVCDSATVTMKVEPVTTTPPTVDAPVCNPELTMNSWTGGTPTADTTSSASTTSRNGDISATWSSTQASGAPNTITDWRTFSSMRADDGFQGAIQLRSSEPADALTIEFTGGLMTSPHYLLQNFAGDEQATITAKNAAGDTIYPQYTSYTAGTVFGGANKNIVSANGGSNQQVRFTFAEPVSEVKLSYKSIDFDIALSQYGCPSFAITANDDDFTTTPVDANAGGTVGSVIDDDTLTYFTGFSYNQTNAINPNIGTDIRDITLYNTTTAQDGTTTLGVLTGAPASGGISMDANGSLQVAAGTTPGTYEYTYQICDAIDADRCNKAVATVRVDATEVDVSVAATTQAAEDATNGLFTFTIDTALGSDLSIPFTLSGTATDGVDMSTMPTSVTIPTGQTSVTLPVTVTADTLDEMDESVIVTITTGSLSSPNVAFTVSTDTATVMIADDDAPAAPTADSTTVNPDGTVAVNATGIPGNSPSAVDDNGDPIASAVCTPDPIGADGLFTCTLPVGTDVNDVNLAQTNPNGETSGPAPAPLPSGPAAPEVSALSVDANGNNVFDVTNAVPGNSYSVTDADGNVIPCLPDSAQGPSVTCTLPAGTPGPVSVTATDPSGQTTTTTGVTMDDNDGVDAADEQAAVSALEDVLTPAQVAALELNKAAIMPNVAALMDKPNADAKGSGAPSPILVQAPAKSVSGMGCDVPRFTSMKLIQEAESGILGGLGNAGLTYDAPASATYDFPHGLVEFQLECSNPAEADGEKSLVNLVFTGLNPAVPLSAYEIVKLTVNGEYKPAANVVGVTLMADDPALGVVDQVGATLVVTVEVQDDASEGDFLKAGSYEAEGQMKLLDPIGPALRTSTGGVTLDKRVNKSEVAVGDFVRYTLVLEDADDEANGALEIADAFPHSGLSYVDGSAKVTINGTESDVAVAELGNDKTLSMTGLPVVPAGGQLTVTYLAQVNAAASGEYVNKARAGISAALIAAGNYMGATNEATATVKVGEDPILDKLTVIGKVFDDVNANGVQDEGEIGIPGARLVTLKGQIITTDNAGRYHVPAVSAGSRDNGRNFYIKLDVRSLPDGYEETTDNPMVQRVTPGLMTRINFGVRKEGAEEESQESAPEMPQEGPQEVTPDVTQQQEALQETTPVVTENVTQGWLREMTEEVSEVASGW
ncbi:MAG: hypothetical protein AAGF06_04645, partial [Pseudomonadota bacterium]